MFVKISYTRTRVVVGTKQRHSNSPVYRGHVKEIYNKAADKTIIKFVFLLKNNIAKKFRFDDANRSTVVYNISTIMMCQVAMHLCRSPCHMS